LGNVDFKSGKVELANRKIELGKIPNHLVFHTYAFKVKDLGDIRQRREAYEEFLFESYVDIFTGITISKTSLIV
jgi:hypothetical protein